MHMHGLEALDIDKTLIAFLVLVDRLFVRTGVQGTHSILLLVSC